MLIDFGRDLCGDLEIAGKREWLSTNGIGGYAAGTIANMLTRRYHGLLMAALEPPLGRTLLVAKLDETAEYDGVLAESGHYYPLYVNNWSNGTPIAEPNGHHHINRFHLEGTSPVWTFAFANALLEKRIWMQPGANTTYVHYNLARAAAPLLLQAKVFANYRDYHNTTIINDWQPEILPIERGLRITMFPGAEPFYLYSDKGQVSPQFEWYEDFLLCEEESRGQNDVEEDHIYAAHLRAILQPGESLTIAASTESQVNMNGSEAFRERIAYENEKLKRAKSVFAAPLPEPVQQLVLAADQFIVKRPVPDDPDGCSIIAGYPWFGDWGRDAMIALPGLTLATGRPQIAANILRTYARYVSQGMIPNRFPDEGQSPEYNTADATLWYVEAVRQYLAATGDSSLMAELYPVLLDIIDWYRKGTRYSIGMDEADALIYAGEEGLQLTWMDAKIDDWVVTPRTGKAVEINALWYNALLAVSKIGRELGEDTEPYETLAGRVKTGFQRFWNAEYGYCFDVLDTPQGENDASLRPNQLLAVSLANSALENWQQRSIVDACGRHLLTAHGLRSLSAEDDEYIGHYGGDSYRRDGAYHQGTTWGWLIGPFVEAHLRVYNNRALARSYLTSLLQHLEAHGVGSISEIFDGDPPFTPRGCTAQAWSVAELLRAWRLTE